MSTLSTTNLKNPSSASNNIVLDSSARVLVGTSTSSNNADGFTPSIQVAGSGGLAAASIARYSGDAFQPQLSLQKSRGGIGAQSLVSASDTLGQVTFEGSDGSSFKQAASIRCEVDGTPGANDMPGRLVFSTTSDGAASPTERMRISSAGEVKINEFTSSGVGLSVREVNTGSVVINADSTRAQNTTWYSFYGTSSSATVLQSYIRGDGAYGSRTSVYGGTSDIKLKENIEPAGSQWSDIKCLQIKKFNFIGDGLRQIGVIAQEVEEVSPGLVDENIDRDSEGNDLGTVTKSVKYSILYMKAVKALQEAMERIETLEASNTGLLARVTALEGA